MAWLITETSNGLSSVTSGHSCGHREHTSATGGRHRWPVLDLHRRHRSPRPPWWLIAGVLMTLCLSGSGWLSWQHPQRPSRQAAHADDAVLHQSTALG